MVTNNRYQISQKYAGIGWKTVLIYSDEPILGLLISESVYITLNKFVFNTYILQELFMVIWK